jgi:hypothetical protein
VRTNALSTLALCVLTFAVSLACANGGSAQPAQPDPSPHQLGDATANGGPPFAATRTPGGQQVGLIFTGLETGTDGGAASGIGAFALALAMPVLGEPGRVFAEVGLKGDVAAQDASCFVHMSVNGFGSSHYYDATSPISLAVNLEIPAPESLRIALYGTCTVTRKAEGAAALLSIDSLEIAIQDGQTSPPPPAPGAAGGKKR